MPGTISRQASQRPVRTENTASKRRFVSPARPSTFYPEITISTEILAVFTRILRSTLVILVPETRKKYNAAGTGKFHFRSSTTGWKDPDSLRTDRQNDIFLHIFLSITGNDYNAIFTET